MIQANVRVVFTVTKYYSSFTCSFCMLHFSAHGTQSRKRHITYSVLELRMVNENSAACVPAERLIKEVSFIFTNSLIKN